MMHIHWFRPKATWGIDGECRCGMLKRRLMGGFGYAFPGIRIGWWDSTSAAVRERRLDPFHAPEERTQ